MIAFPNCKINLGLSVVDKRPDGFHNIESIFYPVDICDVLEIVPSNGPQLEMGFSGLPIPGKSAENLCARAVDLLREKFDFPPIHLHLHKNIPFGAGLGGGSSDAAFTLKLLRDMFSLPPTDDDLRVLATQLGSDCAFFIDNTPCFATGRGELTQKIKLDLSPFFIGIAKPDVSVSTPEAYKMISPKKAVPSVFDIVQKFPPKKWGPKLNNDFEAPVFKRHPAIGQLKEQMYQMGAFYAAMSGSGSAVFGLFENEPDMENHFTDIFSWSGKSF
jgi:4-diphosphocytidyl-2-C-methyl-D-erythritol kinase